jgi:archaellum biogenesis ATPase FlaH
MTTTGITASNYFIEVERIGVETLPETLKKGHDLVVKSTSNGTNWANYQGSESIKKVIDLYFQKLNEYANTVSPKGIAPEPSKAKKPPVKKAEQKVKVKIVKETKEPQHVKHVEHIREEVKFIKRYVGLHNKVKSPSTILAFIKALQRSIVQKLIRKTSPLSEEIEMIQNKLVQAYNKMKGDESFAINDKDLNHLVAIAGGEKVYQSITAIKRYIGLQGKDDQKKINDFIKYLENLVDKKKLTKDDPYADKVNAIYKSLRQRSSTKVSISKAELNGLEGIVKACGCKNEVGRIYDTGGKKLRPCKSKTYSDASRGACSHNRGLSGVLTAEEMATRKLDLLNFFSFWHSLFGNPARNFTMMFHGEPHNGKTIFLLKLAQYLAENFGNVLYVSSEEFASPTMTKKVNEFLNPLPSRLHFAENLQDPDLSDYQFIILDSVNDLGLKINEYKELRKEHPDKAFIFILQHTKAGDFKGGKDWEHIAEIAGEVHKGVVNITKNRYAPKSTLDFFRQFGIQWQEPMAKQKLKPYPINGAMTTKDSQHY